METLNAFLYTEGFHALRLSVRLGRTSRTLSLMATPTQGVFMV